MRLTGKGAVTISRAIQDKAGFQPHSEVEFEVRAKGDVLIRRASPAALLLASRTASPAPSPFRHAFEKVGGSANAAQFKGMGTDASMKFICGEQIRVSERGVQAKRALSAVIHTCRQMHVDRRAGQ